MTKENANCSDVAFELETQRARGARRLMAGNRSGPEVVDRLVRRYGTMVSRLADWRSGSYSTT